MSVLKTKRRESKAEFVNNAIGIYTEALTFVAKLSNRYQRFVGNDVMNLASQVLSETNKAQGIYPHDEITRNARMAHLIEARAALYALDVHMAYVWEAMMTNPEGCFTTTNGRTKTNKEAKDILNRMADSLGDRIDCEFALLANVMKADNMKETK